MAPFLGGGGGSSFVASVVLLASISGLGVAFGVSGTGIL